MIAKLPKLFLIVLMFPFLSRNPITELKRRGPDAPFLEAPLSACPDSNAKPRRAAGSLDGHGKLAVF
jgi:hypothetical protein